MTDSPAERYRTANDLYFEFCFAPARPTIPTRYRHDPAHGKRIVFMGRISDTDGMSRPGSLDPSLLRSFVCIAETGTFTRTGEIVGRSQSAVSMQIRRLEELLGQKLLDRGKGGVVRLTGHGSRFLSRAKEMLALNDTIWAEFHGSTPLDQTSPDDYALPLKAQREAFTKQVMLTLLTDDKFSQAYAMVMRCVETGTICNPTTISTEDDALYMALLSMLEYVSINFLSHTMDREVILRQRKSGLLRVYEVLGAYIAHKREVWRRPNAYRSFEMVVKEYILREVSEVPVSQSAKISWPKPPEPADGVVVSPEPLLSKA